MWSQKNTLGARVLDNVIYLGPNSMVTDIYA